MEIWLSNGNSDKLKIPVNPQSVGSNDTRNFEDIVLSNGDEKTVIGGKNLKTFTLQSFFPASNAYYSEVASVNSPMDYVEKIESWMDDKRIILFQVTTTNINIPTTIRSFNWQENGGIVGDIDYTIELKEYSPVTYSKIIKDPISGTATIKQRTVSSGSVGGNESKPTSVTVVSGDSLWKIAKKHYGDGSKWPKIYEKNKSIVGKNPNLIYPGQKLVIP